MYCMSIHICIIAAYWSSENPAQIVRPRNYECVQEPIMDEESRRLIDDSKLLIDRDRLLLLEIIGQGMS